ncbi:hypothetical protein ACUW9N_000807 [Staphylococcus auricularis]|uniref:Uncharacterized protein n=1 Tax=Staphylococcus auricularis TaxID=29379 RepID=A0AAP8PR70_9STAP|nr:hypothetical protein [Staphylococcus auricularis]MBM0868169.1 hypothetical protein [Staphylococcus auricularis]MCE5038367.1 hypothetical protein [Staphylococcus auricularis]MCG7341689.1 hypothetical protein [Staphylococcus auricularis]MDC6326989.1 hypothetical protein [Staphylococcus auricularis]MDN4532866.1 hypothetical protein [Staphylococcus auricularis]
MRRSKIYFYLSSLLIIISFYFNTRNPLLNTHFNSVFKIIFVCSVINAIILILAIIFADKSIKNLIDRKSWVRGASHALPYILLVVILIHIVAALSTFGFLF